uniref:Uncharacterized protein n=1 Tax=Rhizophora mucronata TaxID=61149 RepID=A0A2P2QVK3_RHIMU
MASVDWPCNFLSLLGHSSVDWSFGLSLCIFCLQLAFPVISS